MKNKDKKMNIKKETIKNTIFVLNNLLRELDQYSLPLCNIIDSTILSSTKDAISDASSLISALRICIYNAEDKDDD